MQIEKTPLKTDRSTARTVKTILAHLVKNAAEHGIEPPVERILARKDETRKFYLNAVESQKGICLECRDDEKGFDYSGLKDIALTKNLISGNGKINNNRLIDIISISGISTVKNVMNGYPTENGLNIVKINVESLNGKKSVSSKTGKGAVIKINVPS